MRTLTCDPVLHCDDIMVVFEGKDRLILHRGEGEQWRVRALWPEPADVRALHAHLGAGRPLLVVLDGEPPVVPLLPEECAGAAWGPDLAGVSTDDGELVEFRIPRLDWLPAALRSRGLDHLQECERLLAHHPHPLLPPLLVAPPQSDAPHIRFAYRTGSAAISASHMAKVASYLFGDPEGPAEVPCPPVHTHH
ncbi:hypothetical protein OG530_16590 [Streptomyces decoyicus]|uniref:hypothetical protein n=1 Tax=Streptomyces decoyicus TaxID=249567 RepID=UPI002E175B49